MKMSKMSVADAAEYFGVSREAIHNRIRRGSLKCELVDGIKLVVVDKNLKATQRTQTKRVASSSNDKYYKLLEEQNAKLQNRVEKLEDETRSLRDQKEQMLIDERLKIEQIYRDKDEQLKSILTTFQEQFMLSPPQQSEQEHLEVEIQEETLEEEHDIISLKKYLKEQKYSEKKCKKIRKRFDKRAKKDNRIVIIGKKYYLDLKKYDYKDLL
jgi:flagellar biosynthesis GTPase FlhF